VRSDEGIRVEHLGEVFQFYGKVLPETGPAFRLQVKSTVKNPESKDLGDVIMTETFPDIKLNNALDTVLHAIKKRDAQIEEK
jgi:hypothetical protein